MNQPSMYLEYSIVGLKPKILDFLSELLTKAKSATDHALTLTMKNRELADLVGRDARTVARYLKELEDKNVIEKKGVRGRGGGMVILFNTDLIRFEPNDGAVINSSEPITLEQIVENNRPEPKKKKEPTRYRRTAREMAEAKVLANKRQTANDILNKQIVDNDGVPSWATFQDTDTPVENYQTYLLTRVYNRYAILFTERHNHDSEKYGEGSKVPTVSTDYDVLPKEFFGTARWTHFDKLRTFCEENDIDPVVYLSAQFSRSVFTSGNRGNKNMLPFVNAMVGDNGYDVFLQHATYQTKFSLAYNFKKDIPPQFAGDLVIKAVREGYRTATKQEGFMKFIPRIRTFLDDTSLGQSQDKLALTGFYNLTKRSLRENNISKESRDAIKKFILMQSLAFSGGIQGLPDHVIVGSESVRLMLEMITQKVAPNNPDEFHAIALGFLTYPFADHDRRMDKGYGLLDSINASKETFKVLDLIQDRQGISVTVEQINKAIQEYGTDRIPLDEFSAIDVKAIVKFMEEKVGIREEELIDPELYTERPPYLPSNGGAVRPRVLREFDELLERELGSSN